MRVHPCIPDYCTGPIANVLRQVKILVGYESDEPAKLKLHKQIHATSTVTAISVIWTQ
jgi:hypothetical protein